MLTIYSCDGLFHTLETTKEKEKVEDDGDGEFYVRF